MRVLYACLYFVAFLSLAGQAQQLGVNEEGYQIHIKKAHGSIKVDGRLDEADWQRADTAANFWQIFPYDTSHALAKTQTWLTFDDNFLYVASICRQSNHYVVTSLRRDFAPGNSDVFSINIDPFRDKLNGFNFAVSPYGVQREGLITNGGDYTTNWDNKWYSAVTRSDSGYIVEMAIPFKTLRYRRQEGINTWLINFVRADITRNETSGWAPIPRNFGGLSLAFSGTLLWESPPPQPGANISLIPYGLVETDRDFQGGRPLQTKLNAGFDAKVAVTPSLNLDVTVNPDFAQVEVDQQVTNLSRFELLYPERRQFFLENSDLFGSFGFSSVNPFFSRRIGLARNPQTGFNEKIPILAGLRLSGRLNKNWRIGLLNMQTGRRMLGDSAQLPAINYGMLAIQRRISTRSYIGLVWVNKAPLAVQASDVSASYNRVLGLEYSLASANNQWQGKAFYYRSYSPNKLPQSYTWGATMQVDKPRFNGQVGLYDVGDNFRAEVGYVPRQSLLRTYGEANFVFYPKGGIGKLINRYYLGPDWDVLYGKVQGRMVDWDAGLFGGITLQNQSQLNFALLRWDYTYLFFPFDPTNTGGPELAQNTSYLYFSNRINFISNVRKPFFFSASTRFGGYFNGQIGQLQGTLSYRQQPYGIFSLDFTYNHIRLPQPFTTSDLLLVGPKVDLSFSRSAFLTAYLQYNNQINNVNTNIRFQWRYKPVSDLYVVYTDNYYAYATSDDRGRLVTSAFQPKNRALVLKLTYWLNL